MENIWENFKFFSQLADVQRYFWIKHYNQILIPPTKYLFRIFASVVSLMMGQKGPKLADNNNNNIM
jgi:hypothetical protein